MSENKDKELINNCVKAQNEFRAKHGCPPLKVNTRLNAHAKEWAEDLAKRDKLEHRPNTSYGENIYLSDEPRVTGDLPAKMWYNEISQYDFQKSEFSPQTGHFTQLIWKGSLEVGVGVARNKGKTWVVANYTPPGNVVGVFKENVPPKRKST